MLHITSGAPAAIFRNRPRDSVAQFFTSASAHPGLLPHVLFRCWRILSVLGTDIELPAWTLQEYFSCINALAAENGKSLRLALFIDGLDEFSGNHQAVVKSLRNINDQYGVKVCVASRPWNVFADAFQYDGSLKMQDRTHKDIKHFIHQEFARSHGFQELSAIYPDETAEILREIGKKAKGVFLWVSIVVKSLFLIVQEDPRLSLLQKTLSELPTDLELLYDAIWRTIDSSKVADASRIF
ncbi:hypothetical protein F5Y15DRAFT_199394 [Xylariaceae sp. FL0016]|nr:hypothetical protein F5Y15DRAFT_199394 [Xylariaceae sp. FL0016]